MIDLLFLEQGWNFNDQEGKIDLNDPKIKSIFTRRVAHKVRDTRRSRQKKKKTQS